MSSSITDDWLWLKVRTSLCICHGILLYEGWGNRHLVMDKCKLVLHGLSKLRQYVAQPVRTDTLARARLVEFRKRNISKAFASLKCIGLCLISIAVVLVEFQDQWMEALPIQLAVHVGAYAAVTALSATSLTERQYDIVMIVFLIYTNWLNSYLDADWLLLASGTRKLLRALGCLAYMKVRVSAPVELLNTIVMICTLTWRPPCIESRVPDYAGALMTVELLSWALTTVLCMVSEFWCTEFIRNELALNDAKLAAERLLDSFCDSVVRLDSDLRIVKATPQLMHLMCPLSPIDPHVLEGTLLSSHLATDTEEDRFASFIASSPSVSILGESSKSTAPALRVNLLYRLGCEVSVELFHVYFEGRDRMLEHLVGIREVRKEGISPDESLCQGHRSSFTHPAPAQGNAVEHQEGSTKLPKFVGGKFQSARSGRSSSSASSKSSKLCEGCIKRKLPGLSSIELKVADLEGEAIQEYLFVLMGDEGHLPKLRSCFFGEGALPFRRWLQESENTLLDGSAMHLDYVGELMFRHPTVACASSKVILCAESARLSLALESLDTCSGPGADDGALKLQLFGVSQISKPAASNFKGRPLGQAELPHVLENHAETDIVDAADPDFSSAMIETQL